MKKELSKAEEVLHRISTQYRVGLWCKFTKALKAYELLSPGDKVCVCISGGKDSMVMALLFKLLSRHSDFPFGVEYLVMNPGYSERNIAALRHNLELLEIPATIVDTDIFAISNSVSRSPCYLCAKMRRGALYRIAKDLGCNKIALGHHYDDVIETTLMNMLNSGSFQTMLPKLPSTNYSGMELIRPLYLIKEEDIVNFSKEQGLSFLQCACRFTEENAESLPGGKQRKRTKALIRELKENYNPLVEKNIFKAGSNVELEKVLGYNVGEETHSFLDEYEDYRDKTFARIDDSGAEDMAIAKAEKEHLPFKFDLTYKERFLKSNKENATFAGFSDKKENNAMIYDYSLTTGKGETLDLASMKGKVILVVNTATGCGFTPQYAPIEELYRKYHDKGLEILDIPCNQFGSQAPGSDEEIHEFCSLHYNTTFPQMKKADVNGPNELPLYTYLKKEKGFEGFDPHPYKELLEGMFAKADPDWDKKSDIKWNFTKFVVDRSGKVVARFEPTADMAKVEECILALL